VNEADRLAIAQIKEEANQRPLDDLLEDIQDRQREEPGQFWSGIWCRAVFSLAPCCRSCLREEFREEISGRAASETGKMTAAAL
jgi:hypothetical protein